MYEKNHESQGKIKMTKQHWLLLTFYDFPVYNVSETWLIIIQTSKYKKTLFISNFAWIVVPVWDSSDLANQGLHASVLVRISYVFVTAFLWRPLWQGI